MTTNSTTPGDYRRASLLTMYRRQDNKTGEIAIIEETNETGRSPQLLFALLVLHKTFIVRFRTPDGIDLFADYFHGIATLEGEDVVVATNAIVRAAQIIDHHGHGDRQAIAQVMNTATGEGRGTETILALLDHYEVALPELSSSAGSAFLEAHAAAMREEEFKPDEEGGGLPS